MDGEVVVERRRQGTSEQKAALSAEVEAEGGQVSVLARRHGLSHRAGGWTIEAVRRTEQRREIETIHDHILRRATWYGISNEDNGSLCCTGPEVTTVQR